MEPFFKDRIYCVKPEIGTKIYVTGDKDFSIQICDVDFNEGNGFDVGIHIAEYSPPYEGVVKYNSIFLLRDGFSIKNKGPDNFSFFYDKDMYKISEFKNPK